MPGLNYPSSWPQRLKQLQNADSVILFGLPWDALGMFRLGGGGSWFKYSTQIESELNPKISKANLFPPLLYPPPTHTHTQLDTNIYPLPDVHRITYTHYTHFFHHKHPKMGLLSLEYALSSYQGVWGMSHFIEIMKRLCCKFQPPLTAPEPAQQMCTHVQLFVNAPISIFTQLLARPCTVPCPRVESSNH